MPDTKITALTAIGANPIIPSTFPIPMVDLTDTSMAASGTTKKVTVNQILGAGGTATLASATITGDLTVDTSTLKVDSANNRVGIGTASPGAGYALDVVGAARITAANGLVIDKAGAGFVDFLNSGNAGANVGTSGTGGLVIYTANGIGGAYSVRHTIAGDGVATWSNVGGVAGTAMTLNSTGLGVGTSPSYKIHALSTVPDVARFERSGAGGAARIQLVNGSGTVWYFRNGVNDLVFNYEGTDLVTFGSTGNVGVGVTPSAWSSPYKSIELDGGNLSVYPTTDFYISQNAVNVGGWKYKATGFASQYIQVNSQHRWQIAASGTAGNAITFTQAMTLDASGILMVGTTNSVIWNTTNTGCVVGGNAFQASRSDDVSLLLNRLGSNGKIALFARQGGEVGDISVTTTGTTFNSTSDYRLKEAVAPLSGGLARVNALKPSIYNWKSNGSTGEGFLAHELAEVVPAAVTGEKDAVNEDGSIKAQSIDMSRVVPILVAAIQELTAEVNALKKA